MRVCGLFAHIDSVFIDRSGNSKVTVYQDWLVGPDYPGKSPEETLSDTACDLIQVKNMLIDHANNV